MNDYFGAMSPLPFGTAIKANPGDLLKNSGSMAAGSPVSMAFDPITAAVQFGVGAIESISKYNQQMDAARQQNRQNLKAWEKQVYNQRAQYALRVKDYEQTLRNITESSQYAYQAEDLRINELLKGTRFARQSANIAQAQAMGQVAASGRAGASAARMSALTAAAFGRQEAARAESLFAQGTASDLRRRKINMDANQARQAAFSKVSWAPIDPDMPEAVEGPSAMDLLGSMTGVIGGAALGGFDAGRANKALLSKNFLKD